MNKTIFSFLILFILFPFSCKKEEPDPLEGVSLIASFIATNHTISQGETTTLLWGVVLADKIWIEPEIGDVWGEIMIDISPKVTTTYTLHASYTYILNGKPKTKTESKSLTITVIPVSSPIFPITMWVVPPIINEGESAAVNWIEAYDASKVQYLKLIWDTYGQNGYPFCGHSARIVTGTSYVDQFQMYCTSVNQVTAYFSLEVHFNDGSIQIFKDSSATLIINR